jgi:hypothetical protein|tara:strand:- start:415 stop:657 length:243 start_codon:yes stop_codon:yes gene_type:complete
MEQFETHNIETRFGTFTIEYGELDTAPTYLPEYMVEIKFNDTYLGHTIITGDPRDMDKKALATIFSVNQKERTNAVVELS